MTNNQFSGFIDIQIDSLVQGSFSSNLIFGKLAYMKLGFTNIVNNVVCWLKRNRKNEGRWRKENKEKRGERENDRREKEANVLL